MLTPRLPLPVAVVAGALVLAACSGDEAGPGPTDTAATSVAGPGRSGDSEVATTAKSPETPPADAGSTGPPSTAPPSTATTPATATAAPAPTITADPALGDARELALALYGGGEVRLDPEVAEVLTPARLADAAEQDRAVSGSTGTWDEVPVAVLTSGDDVTLAVGQDGGWQVVGGWWPSLGVDAAVPTGARTVLLVGSDAREADGERVDRSRADAIQLVATDGQDGGGVVGIARDSWVEVPGHGWDKINAALARGGPDLLVETVSGSTGVDVDGYLLIGFDGFRALIQDLGGLPIVLAAAQQAMWADLPEGEQTLTGPQGLALSRERASLPDGDFGRSRNQGLMVLAGLEAARGEGPGDLPRLVTALDEHTQSDLSAREVLVLLSRAHVVDPDRVGHDVATGTFDTSSDGQSIVRWDDAARSLFADVADGRLGD